MSDNPTRVVVAGGGTAGWIAATAIARMLGRLVEVTLVESEAIGTVGVGEATIPTARTFHDFLKIDEQSFLKATQATIKLGIAFENWARIGDRYIHSFGSVPLSTWMADFQHFWLQGRAEGHAGPLGDYYPEYKAAEAGRFTKGGETPLNYAYHLDAGLYAKFLRQIGENDGVKRIEGKIARVEQQGETGDIAALHLDGGTRIEGDLFIDCTGFRGLLIEETLKAGYEDWSHWLPTNAALAVQTEAVADPIPYTRSIAHEAGWQWRIPLQHRVGNGIVFSTDHMEVDAAREKLFSTVEGKPLIEPRLIRYKAGKRRQMWVKNCLSLGLSSGFVEPLESTSIHLFMIGVTRLLQQFPFGGITPEVRERYNRMADNELIRVRDFIILHYKLTERDDSPFWRYCRDMSIPDSLAERIALFRETAQAWQAPDDLFRVDSWLQVMIGQRLEPKSWHKQALLMTPGRLEQTLATMRERVAATVAGLPTHQQFIDSYCRADA
ncbi:tryptophan halogenase family protein [Pseudokordiimonas caeni]|uniref:tryptophan halogenase family protein n=1 Tax=Pseudokordiimonas caeni TaxID=2997908 RepID=UPI0028117619|nr:tryptophan 7-halogenase [Pseudokordiimonas caeni]